MEVLSPVFEGRTPFGEMNFIGAVRTYLELTTEGCSEETKGIYIRDYNERIFPVISPAVAIKDYTEETIVDIRQRIKDQNNYDEGTLRSRYDHLLTDPCEAFFKAAGLEHNPIWGSRFKLHETDDEPREEKVMRTKKSLSPTEELKAEKALLSIPETDDGAMVGLATMFLSALRNAEACGLNFGDLVEFEYHKGRYYLRVYETTSANSNLLKLGGKTYNSPRLVPIPKALSDFLLRRKKYIESVVTFPVTDRDGTIHKSVDTLPIVCRKNAFTVRCDTKDLSVAGRNLLRYKLKIGEERVCALNVAMSEDWEEFGEKDVTTYLFRRNMATHLYALHFMPLQIQYYMGHRLENTDLKRSDFTDQELLYEMSVLLDAHPLNKDREIRENLDETTARCEWKDVPEVSLDVDPQGEVKRYFLKVSNREIGDPLRLHISGEGCNINIHSSAEVQELRSEVNITKQMRAAYREKEK